MAMRIDRGLERVQARLLPAGTVSVPRQFRPWLHDPRARGCRALRLDRGRRVHVRPERREDTVRFSYTVSVELEREEGKFMSRDEAHEQLEEALASSNPESIQGENGGVYNVIEWEITSA